MDTHTHTYTYTCTHPHIYIYVCIYPVKIFGVPDTLHHVGDCCWIYANMYKYI